MNTSSVTDVRAQLELGFLPGSLMVHAEPRRSGRQMASWWFQRMREAVDRAAVWTPAPAPRPEQIWLPNTQRSVCLESAGTCSARAKQLCA